MLSSVPGIGRRFAERLHDELGLNTLEELEAAAHDGRLATIAGFGVRRLAGVRDSLAHRLGRVRSPSAGPAVAPSVAELLDIDREYREKAAAGQLRLIAPRRFNPAGEAWLPSERISLLDAVRADGIKSIRYLDIGGGLAVLGGIEQREQTGAGLGDHALALGLEVREATVADQLGERARDQIGAVGDVDTAAITLRYESGALAVIDNCREAPYGYDQRVEVLGSAGAPEGDSKTKAKGGLPPDNRPFPVGYAEFPWTPLPARDGVPHGGSSIDLLGRVISMGNCHRAFMLTGAMCLAVAARIKDGGFYVIGTNAMLEDNLPIHAEIRAVAAKGNLNYPVSYLTEGFVAGLVVEDVLKRTSWPATPQKVLAAMNSLKVDLKGLRGGPLEWTKDNHFRTRQYYRVWRWDPPTNRIMRAQDWHAIEVKR